MLAKRPRVAKPRQVAEVHQDACTRSMLVAVPDGSDDLFTEHVFVTDVGRNDLAIDREQGLAQGAAVEIPQWYVHCIDEPSESRRHEFAEWNEVLLVVAHVGASID